MSAHRQLIRDGIRHRRRTDDAGRDLQILFTNGLNDVAGRQVVRRDTIRIEPHAHRIVAGAEDDDLSGAGKSSELVADIQQRIVAQVDRIISTVGGHEVHDHRDVRRALLGDHPERADLFRQSRQRLVHAILHLDLGEIDGCADVEGHGEVQHTVRGRRRR